MIDPITALTIPALRDILKIWGEGKEEQSKIKAAIKKALKKTCETFPGLEKNLDLMFDDRESLDDVLAYIAINEDHDLEGKMKQSCIEICKNRLAYTYHSEYQNPELQRFIENNDPGAIIDALFKNAREQMGEDLPGNKLKLLMSQQKRTVNEVKGRLNALSRQIGLLEVTFIEKIEEVIRKFEHSELKSSDIDDMIRVYANNALPEFEAGFRRYLMDVRNDSIKQKYAGEFTYVRNNLSIFDPEKFYSEKRLTDEKGHDMLKTYNFENIGNAPFSRRIFYGGAGVGKTIFFYYLEKELLRDMLLRTDSLRLPVYISIPHLYRNSLRKILKEKFRHFMQNANSLEKLDNIIDKMIYDNRFLFLFDSFDQTNNTSSTAFEALCVNIVETPSL